jgi:quercetin dioxygenase-like cupin family protein
MIAWKSLQLLLLCAILAAWSNAQAQEAKPNDSHLQPVYSAANPKGGWKVKTQETRGAYSVLDSIVQPSSGPEPHRHSREDEGFYILEGQYEFRVGTQVINAGPGDFLFAPRNVPHTYKNVGTTPSRHLTIISPGGLESFFAERAALQIETPPSHPEYLARYKALQEKYGPRVQHRMAVLAAAAISHNSLLQPTHSSGRLSVTLYTLSNEL